MRSRVEELWRRTDGMWIMTFHAMCLRILRYHCELIGYDHNFVIYDGTDQKTIVKNILKEQNVNDKEFGVPIPAQHHQQLQGKSGQRRPVPGDGGE